MAITSAALNVSANAARQAPGASRSDDAGTMHSAEAYR
jgi:hypothetical protein